MQEKKPGRGRPKKKVEKDPGATSPPPPRRLPLPVKRVIFRKPLDIPGKPSTTSVSSVSSNDLRGHHHVLYMPWLRAFWVEYHSPSHSSFDGRFIPEDNVRMWEPTADTAPWIQKLEK
jgi:hypothetical protein